MGDQDQKQIEMYFFSDIIVKLHYFRGQNRNPKPINDSNFTVGYDFRDIESPPPLTKIFLEPARLAHQSRQNLPLSIGTL